MTAWLTHTLAALAIMAAWVLLAGVSAASGQRERAAERMRRGGGGA